MAEQVQANRSLLIPLYRKSCSKKEEEEEGKKWAHGAQNKADQTNRLWGYRTCWEQHPVYLDGITKVS